MKQRDYEPGAYIVLLYDAGRLVETGKAQSLTAAEALRDGRMRGDPAIRDAVILRVINSTVRPIHAPWYCDESQLPVVPEL